jgi:predicted aspartyl protease
VTFPFDPTQSRIIIGAELSGPTATVNLNLLLDTGASDTVIDESWLAVTGYTPANATGQFKLLTAGGTVPVLQVPVVSISALGQSRTNFPVLAHSLPSGTSHDGVLGLDFLRGNVLTIDFLKGEITLAPSSPAGAVP